MTLGPTETLAHPGPGFEDELSRYFSGNAADVTTRGTGGLALVGGGDGIDQAIQWFIDAAGHGDIVVLRASGTDEYNTRFMAFNPDSVETFVFKARGPSSSEQVLEAMRKAEGIFIAGGDQSNYVNFWQGTPIETELNAAIQRGVAIGGTSAGLAVLGEFYFSAMNDTVVSSEALANPYGENVTVGRNFLTMPFLKGVITDTHFAIRDRMGRLLTFMSRILQDGWAPEIHAIAAEEDTALVVTPGGLGKVVANQGHIYLLKSTRQPSVCQANTPLSFDGVQVRRLSPGDTIDLQDWATNPAFDYTLSVNNGVITSSNGSIY